jgi:hypothetical protein
MTDQSHPALPLRGEEWLSALLLAMVVEHCAGYSPEARKRMRSYLSPDASPEQWLDSYNIPANAEAMQEIHHSGEIEIAEQDGTHIVARLTPRGRALLDRLRAERQEPTAITAERPASTGIAGSERTLSVSSLGTAGSLRRRDIYGDSH